MNAVTCQVVWATGEQAIVCPECEKSMNVRVSGVKRGSDGRLFRNVRGTCPHCRTMQSWVKCR